MRIGTDPELIALALKNFAKNGPDLELDPEPFRAGFRIRIDLMRIRIRIRIQHFSNCGSGFRIRIPDPDPGFGDLKLKKIYNKKLSFYFF